MLGKRKIIDRKNWRREKNKKRALIDSALR